MTAIETMIQATLAQHPEIRLAILFGSLATGDGHHESDVDLAIDAGLPLEMQAKISLMAEIAESTGRPVDLIDLRTIGGAPARADSQSRETPLGRKRCLCRAHQAASVRRSGFYALLSWHSQAKA